MAQLLVATRSRHKLAEIRKLLGDAPGLELLNLDEAGLPELAEEEHIEVFDSFEENALAKARYFSRRSGLPTLADDSGISVDALDGRPGVRSKRFSGRSELSGDALDNANNQFLLSSLLEVTSAQRTAHYSCCIALVDSDGREQTFLGRVDGRILHEPRGTGGFGYDPLFFIPELNATFGEVSQEQKDRISHRSRALAAARSAILELS